MTPAKPIELPTTFWGFCSSVFSQIISRDGVAWCLLMTLTGGMIWGLVRTIEIVGPSASKWLETSASTTANLGDNVVLLTASVALNTKRLDDQQETMKVIVATVLANGLKMDADAKSMKELVDSGSAPARETAEAMKAANVMMLEVSAKRDKAIAEQTELLKEMVQKLGVKQGP
jgi:hypothetical protein